MHNLATHDPQEIARAIARALQGREVSPDAEVERKSAQGIFDAAKKALKDKHAELKNRKLKGKERQVAILAEIDPLNDILGARRNDLLEALKKAVPRPELALGQRPDCLIEEIRSMADEFLPFSSVRDRTTMDMLAAFGSDACETKHGRIRPTPFCFIDGSGKQWFLDTARQLMTRKNPTKQEPSPPPCINEERIRRALFEPWDYRDETLSMRWDPVEDRRYALMDRDPTAADNKPRTVWMANLLAYRSLVLFPSAPTARGLGTTAWVQTHSGSVFTWPIWEQALGPEVIQSMLQLTELQEDEIDHRNLRARGIAAVFRSRRIEVGNPPLQKVNFAPACGV
jgi:hypothetical protein